MKHLTLSEHGSFCKLQGERILVFNKDQMIFECTLNRLKTISIVKQGVTLTSNLLIACAMRGIQLFIMDYTGKAVCSVQGGLHRTAKVRENQFNYINSNAAKNTAVQFILAKIKNQAAVLKYFGKAKNRLESEKIHMHSASNQIGTIVTHLINTNWSKHQDWRFILLGFEGSAAKIYWDAVKKTGLVCADFDGRRPRNNNDITNSMLNYAYAILSSWIWQAITNAGLELYAGILHTSKPGKPSLVLDIMEEFRPWCADRIIFKLHARAQKNHELSPALKKVLISEMAHLYAKPLPYHKRRISLESIIQRQIYHLSAVFSGEGKYKGYLFKW